MNSLTQFIFDNPFSFVFGSVLMFGLFTFVLCQKRIVERNMSAENIEVNDPIIEEPVIEAAPVAKPVADPRLEDLTPDEKYLLSQINVYRGRRYEKMKLFFSHLLCEEAKHHLRLCYAAKEIVPYQRGDADAALRIKCITNNSKVTIKEAFSDILNCSQSTEVLFDKTVSCMGVACEYHNNALYVCILFARIDPALDLP